jgi:SAM-dependent methyltransferase
MVNVESYFKSIGVGRPKSDAVYVKQGLKKFGKAFEDLTFLIGERANGVGADPYEDKNSSLDLSLYVGEYHVSNVWREFASWLVKENLPTPSEVLDLGCENGVLTCLYAILWPDAKVIGVERSPAAVAAARELAKRLSLGNVSFEQSDARRYLDANVGRFQVITATLVMHEFLAEAGRRKPFTWESEYERIEDITLTGADLHTVETLKAVVRALTTGGILISLDRSPHLASKWWYTQCLEAAGMKVSLARSYVIECSHPSGVERFPLTVARRAREDESKTTPAEIVSLASFRELSALKLSLQADLADAFVRSIGPTEIMFDAVCEYLDGSGIRTIQLLKAPAFLVVHDFTNHGFRTAGIAPLVALPQVLSQCNDLTTELEAHCIVQKSVTEAAILWLSRLDCPTNDEWAPT